MPTASVGRAPKNLFPLFQRAAKEQTMNPGHAHSAFTLVDLLAVIAIIGILIVVGCGVVSENRENARITACASNIRQFGAAVQNFENVEKYFPASGKYQKDQSIQWGYSWLVYILPYLEGQDLYDNINIMHNPDPQTNKICLETRPNAFICPSYSGAEWATPPKGASPGQGGIANYKTMGATHHASLICATSDNPTAPFGQLADHPNGGLIPGRQLRISDFVDGVSYTIIACETIEETYAQWHIGQYAALVGLPLGYNYAKAGTTPGLDFYAPTGFTLGCYEDDTTVINAKELGTYLNWDYKATPYDPALPMKYGPSSYHKNVVNHLFGDNAVRGITKKMDPALYMFTITRNGGDPNFDQIKKCR
jgi:type II secretory pathway pseudopilin PulG